MGRVYRTDWANTLLFYIRAAKLPIPIREFPGIEGRRHRFDLAWPELKLAVECHGGEFMNKGHGVGKRLAMDCEKANLAQLQGWMLLAFTGHQVGKKTRYCLGQIEEALKVREALCRG